MEDYWAVELTCLHLNQSLCLYSFNILGLESQVNTEGDWSRMIDTSASLVNILSLLGSIKLENLLLYKIGCWSRKVLNLDSTFQLRPINPPTQFASCSIDYIYICTTRCSKANNHSDWELFSSYRIIHPIAWTLPYQAQAWVGFELRSEP